MIRATSVATAENVEYPRLIKGKPLTGGHGVIAYQMDDAHAIVLLSSSLAIPAGKMITDRDSLLKYYEVFHGTLTLES